MPRSQSFVIAVLCAAFTPFHAWADAAADVSIDTPYVRAMPPGQPNTAAFMILSNAGGVAHSLTEARSPVAEVVELHNHVMEDGMMKMRRIPQIDVSPEGSVELKPGGLHIMLINLGQALPEGVEVPLTLVFKDGSSLEVKAPVRKIEVGAMHHHHHAPVGKE